MNWLAHLLLSEPSPEYRLGNLLPDLVRPADYAAMPATVMRGIACHRFIDRFTDSHSLVRQSIRRIPAPHSRVAGILIDMLYDHFLAVEWSLYCAMPLEDFAHEVYQGFTAVRSLVSPDLAARLQAIAGADVLCSYRSLEGIEIALRRISARMRGEFALEAAMPSLREHYSELRGDFAVFFPDLRRQVAEFAQLQTTSTTVTGGSDRAREMRGGR